jgi:hypothetical protein
VVAGPPFPQDRRVPHGGISAHDTRQVIKAQLIYAEDALLLFLRPLFEGRPDLVAPACNRRFVALPSAPRGLLEVSAERLAQAADMGEMVGSGNGQRRMKDRVSFTRLAQTRRLASLLKTGPLYGIAKMRRFTHDLGLTLQQSSSL